MVLLNYSLMSQVSVAAQLSRYYSIQNKHPKSIITTSAHLSPPKPPPNHHTYFRPTATNQEEVFRQSFPACPLSLAFYLQWDPLMAISPYQVYENAAISVLLCYSMANDWKYSHSPVLSNFQYYYFRSVSSFTALVRFLVH